MGVAEGPVTPENILLHVPLCGCGNPEEGLALILKLLTLFSQRPSVERYDELNALLPDTGVRMVVLGALDNEDLIEHGGSIEGSWLTDHGKQMLEVLTPHAASEFEELLP